MTKTQFELALRWAGEIARDSDFIALLAAKLIKPLLLERRIVTMPVAASQQRELVELVKQLVGEIRAKRRATRQKKLPCRKR